jgi:amidohydrolase
MANDLARDLTLLDPDLVALRRDLHRHPELSFAEHRTATLIAERTRALGLSVRTCVGGTGVVADLKGEEPGPTLLLRADMDALPVTEQSQRDFASTVPGVMHACGHDAHVTALLGAATLLAARRHKLAGRVRFAFQPAEEVAGGARAMIADGVLDGVDRALAAHVAAPAPFGVVLSRPGPFMAGFDAFELTVHGKAGHGGIPQSAVDPVFAAAHVLLALQSIVARETRPGEPVVLTIGAIEGGRAPNVVVDQVTLRGTVRWFLATERARVLARIEEIAAGVCAGLRARSEFKVLYGAPVTTNERAPVDLIEAAVAATGRAAVFDPGPFTSSEDFSEFLERVPGCMICVGCGGPSAAPHHHHAFDLDERAIGLTAEIFTRAALFMLAPP